MMISNSFSGNSYTSISLGSFSKDCYFALCFLFLRVLCKFRLGSTCLKKNSLSDFLDWFCTRKDPVLNWRIAELKSHKQGSEQIWSNGRKNQKTWRQVLWNYPVRGKQCMNKRIACLGWECYLSTRLPGIRPCTSEQSKGLIHYWDLCIPLKSHSLLQHHKLNPYSTLYFNWSQTVI